MTTKTKTFTCKMSSTTIQFLLFSLIASYCYAEDGRVPVVLPASILELLKMEKQSFDLVGKLSVDGIRRYYVAAEVAHNVARRMQATYANDGRNYLMSPLSVAVTVGELLLGSRGPTYQRLRELLTDVPSPRNLVSKLSDEDIHRELGTAFESLQKNGSSVDDTYQLKAASTLFMQIGLMVKTKYLNEIKRHYGSEYSPADFRNDPINTLNAINKWGSDNTNGLISHILAAPLPPRTAVVLMNAIYFRAPWKMPFSAALTKAGHFRINGSHVIEVQQMRGQFDIKYAENDLVGCRLVVLPYKRDDVKMYVILPNQGVDLRKFATQFTWAEITAFVKTATEESVILVLPKMRLTASLSLKDPIFNYRPSKKDGMSPKQGDWSSNGRAGPPAQKPRTTTQRARTTTTPGPRPVLPVAGAQEVAVTPPSVGGGRLDLTGASNDERFLVDDVLHQVTLEVTETGTEAAAVSIGSSYYSGNVKNFKVDRPFLFFIRHEASLVNLFWGYVTDPTNGEYS